MIRLWGRTSSSNVMKVMWLLDELGLAHERIDAGGPHGRTDTPEYRAMNPWGLVPVLEDGAVRLFESNAILRYLCRAHARASALYPAEAAGAAPVDAWLDVSQTTLAPPHGRLFLAVARTAPERRDPALIAEATAAAGAVWRVLAAQLVTRDYIAAPHLTIADMAYGPHLHRWFAMPIERPDIPHLRDWYDRLAARPAYARTCMVPPA